MKNWILLTSMLLAQNAAAQNSTHDGGIYCGVQSENELAEEKIYSTPVKVEYLAQSDGQKVAGIHAQQTLDLPNGIQAEAQILGGGYGYTYFSLSLKNKGKKLTESTFRLNDKLAYIMVFEDQLADLNTSMQIGKLKVRCEFGYR